MSEFKRLNEKMLAAGQITADDVARAGDEGRLFGSVGTADVTEAIKKFTGIEVARAIVRIGTPIKEIGLHEVTLAPHPDVEVKVTLDVIPA